MIESGESFLTHLLWQLKNLIGGEQNPKRTDKKKTKHNYHLVDFKSLKKF